MASLATAKSSAASRRIKKRNTGVTGVGMMRTVTLTRGDSGFGFTLSGQHPPILGGILANSSAQTAGIKVGDRLISANGRNVSSATHEEVVGLIASTTGPLRLQIADDHGSSSSSDEDGTFKGPLSEENRNPNMGENASSRTFQSDDERYARPLSPGGPIIHLRGNSADSTMTDSSVVQRAPPFADLATHRSFGSSGTKPRRPSPRKKLAPVVRTSMTGGQGVQSLKVHSPSKCKQVDLQGSEELHLTERQINSFLHPTFKELRESARGRTGEEAEGALFRSVIGYLGTIEMPKSASENHLSAISSCIKRLRVEKKVHTMVLMCVLKNRITLINHHGLKLAEYPSDQISFCGMCKDDKRFFGLVTVRSVDNDNEEVDVNSSSSSCHVFLTEHVNSEVEMDRRARAFQFTPSFNENSVCNEFPSNADPIIRAIMSTYGKVVRDAKITQPSSPHITTESADSENQVEDEPGTWGRFDVRAMPHPQESPLSTSSRGDDSFNTERLDAQNSAANLRFSMQKYLITKQQHLQKTSEKLSTSQCSQIDSSQGSSAADSYFRANFPLEVEGSTNDRQSVSRSLEDLKNEEYDDDSAGDLTTVSEDIKAKPMPAPLARYLHNSESNLSQLSAVEATFNNAVEAQGRTHTAPSSGVKTNILRPGEQYPSEPGVLKSSSHQNRPISAQSERSDRSTSNFSHECDRESVQSAGAESVTSVGAVKDNTKNNLKNDAMGRVESWATNFEKLLQDPVGLQTFTEFLKKEFSAENIFFWASCERFRRLVSPEERKIAAEAIVNSHLGPGASDPVNVDSHARQAAENGMADPSPDTFELAQKQIYNLMKFDSFSRFLKSDIYKDSVSAESAGAPLPFEDVQLYSELELNPREKETKSKDKDKGKKSKWDSENRRRSLLPWNNLRGKDRSKSKDRLGESKGKAKAAKTIKEDDRPLQDESQQKPNNSGDEPVSLNASNSSEGDANGAALARVILPDKATTVVQTKHGETIRSMVTRLLDKRGLKYTSFDVFSTQENKPLDLSEECASLGCLEVRVEPRVLFRLELPSKKSIGVKAKPAKIVHDVLGPILNQYGWSLDTVIVMRDVYGDPIDLNDTVSSIDNSRLIVALRSVDELNASILEDLMRGKRPGSVGSMGPGGYEDARSVHTTSSRGSSGNGEANRNRLSSASLGRIKSLHDDERTMPPPNKIPVARRSHPKLLSGRMSEGRLSSAPTRTSTASLGSSVLGPNVTEELYEGLKLAQRGRLDDQRGTEINFEMPDFIKRNRLQQDGNGSSRNVRSPLFHRQSAPNLPYAAPHARRRDVFPTGPFGPGEWDSNSGGGRFSSASTANYYSQVQDPHSLSPTSMEKNSFSLEVGQANLDQNGFLPTTQEADRFFNIQQTPHRSHLGGGDISSRRVSLGFGVNGMATPRGGYAAKSLPHFTSPLPQPPLIHPSEEDSSSALYETLSHYQGDVSGHSYQTSHAQQRREPPPLPPKPRLNSVGQAVQGYRDSDLGTRSSTSLDLVQQETGNQGQRGYAVSFV